MCGIIAVINKNKKPIKAKIIDKMLKKIEHRGPDDEGIITFKEENKSIYYSSDTSESIIKTSLPYSPTLNLLNKDSLDFDILLGHRRLSIQDLSELGHQPMCDDSERYWITFNGEVYNFEEIKVELENLGHKFISHTDTEILLKSYIQWGDDCQKKFNGMWSVIIYDSANKSIWISRDRFGIKPLYYYEDNDFLIFCSEVKQLLPLINLKENKLETYSFLLFQNDESIKETSFKNVFRFPNAHSVKFNINNISIEPKCYYKINPNIKSEKFDEKKAEDYATKYYNLLKESVKLRLKSDVNVGITLSGGLDSSSIGYLVNEIRSSTNETNKSMHSFSNVYEEKELIAIDESNNINLLNKQLKLIPHKKSPSIKNFIELIKMHPYIYDLPNNGYSIGYDSVFRLPKEYDVTVILDGQGADEQLAGYPAYWVHYLSTKSLFDKYKIYKKNDIPLKEVLKSFLIQKKSFLLKRKLKQIKKNASEYNIEISHELEDYLIYRLDKYYSKFNDLNEFLVYSMNTNLLNLVSYADKHAMQFSLEARFPFLDYRLVDFLATVPAEYKLYNGYTKYIARLAFDKKIDDKVVWDKEKLGFPSPQELWYKNIKVREFIEKTLEINIKKDKYYEKKLILHFWRKHYLKES